MPLRTTTINENIYLCLCIIILELPKIGNFLKKLASQVFLCYNVNYKIIFNKEVKT